MKPHAFLILIFSFWLSSIHASDVDMAALSGTCHNVTGNADGHLKIVFAEEGDKLGGFVSVSGWLRGVGNITGTRSGTKFRFNTTDHTGQIIKWQGDVQNGKLSGEYYIDAKRRDTATKWGMERNAGWQHKSRRVLRCERHVQPTKNGS